MAMEQCLILFNSSILTLFLNFSSTFLPPGAGSYSLYLTMHGLKLLCRWGLIFATLLDSWHNLLLPMQMCGLSRTVDGWESVEILC